MYILLIRLTKDRHKQHEFFKGFDGITVSAHVKTVKPEPAIYQVCLARDCEMILISPEIA